MKKIGVLIVLFCGVMQVHAQSNRVISTLAPLLMINSDARSAGMGDVGVATTSDASSIFHNSAKMAFNTSEYTYGINYTPWLQDLVDGLFIGGGSIINRIDERSAWGANIRFFSLGQIQLFDSNANSTGVENPSEMSIAGSYSLKLSDYYSMGVALRYIRSDLAIKSTDTDLQAINAFSVDISGFYQSPERNYGNFNGRIRAGFNLSNLGPKASYTASGKESFIPSRMRLGAGFDFILDDYNTIAVTFETSKLLVPTPPQLGDHDNDPNTPDEIIAGKSNDVGWVAGIFQSFGDAPDGFSEEMQEFTWALGAEYLYDDAFAIRAGYFHESEFKGNRQFFTLGGGIKAKSFNVDLSYLVNTSNVNNPLAKTLRFSVSFDMGDIFENF